MRQKLGLQKKDLGIDLVAETPDGKYWAIQCKYHHEPEENLTLDELRPFFDEAHTICEGKFSTLLAISLANDYSKFC